MIPATNPNRCTTFAPLNYFAHYFFDHIEDDAYHNFGLSAPDFVRNFIRGKKLKRIKPEDLGHFPSVRLAEGSRKHILRDNSFHASAFFNQMEQQVNQALKPAFVELDMQRYWFAAHLLSEMMIDRVLMKQHPSLMDQYYIDLEQTNLGEVSLFLKGQGIDDTSDFETRMSHFIDVQYLKRYVDDEALTYSLNRIFMFTGAGEKWTDSQFRGVQAVIPEVELLIFENMHILTEEMH